MFTPRLSLPRAWYGKHHPLGHALAPLSWLFRAAASVRRLVYRYRLVATYHPGIPVVVVGNITTGGTGKTPLVIWLARFLGENGFRPAIVTRGYGGKVGRRPQWVDANADPRRVGDEAVLLARRTRCKVVAAPDRVAAVRELLARSDCDLILTDDGLQHYALERDVEIAVVDGILGYGNGRCLPAGPLREPVSRLATVDFVVVNHGSGQNHGQDHGQSHGHDPDHNPPDRPPHAMRQYTMTLVPGDPRRVSDEREVRPMAAFRDTPVHAVCGIGHPDRFFRMLRRLALTIKPHAFPDHHAFDPAHVTFGDRLPVLMTEKDAVKCRRFAGPDHWYVPVEAGLESAFGARLLTLLRSHDFSLAADERPIYNPWSGRDRHQKRDYARGNQCAA